MLRSFQHYIAQHSLLQPSDSVLVAVSGGADSVALLDLLLRSHYTCIAAHCNFHLRGTESDRDEQFVRDLCEQLQVPLHVQHFDTQAYARAHAISVEMAARELRYTYFEQLRSQLHCEAIAVAHHQNDQAETLLLNLLRGTGIRGLNGMHPRNGYIVRPLLFSTHQDLLHYLTIRHLSHVEDSTNGDENIKRNALRKQLTAYSPAEIQHIATTADRLQGYTQIIDNYIDTIEPTLIQQTTNRTEIDLQTLLTYPAPATILYELLKDYHFTTPTDDILAHLHHTGRRFYSPTHIALLDRERLLIYPLTNSNKFKLSQTISNNLKQFQTTSNHFKLSQTIRDRLPVESYPAATALCALFDADRITSPLTIRPLQAGDSFCPIGMHGKRKLVADLLTDLHIPLIEKQQTQVLCHNQDILWVIGHRIDDRYKITPQTKRVLQCNISVS